MIPLVGHSPASIERYHSRSLEAFGRMADGASPEQVRSEMAAFSTRLAEEHPGPHEGFSLIVKPLEDLVLRDFQAPVLALLGASVLLLLIGCANVAHLLLMRAASQRRQVALQLALGLSTGGLFRQMLVGGLVMALPAGVLGLLLSGWGTSLLLRFSPSTLPDLVRVEGGGLIAVAAVVLTLATGVLFGGVPMLQARRMNLQEVLGEGGRTSDSSPATARRRSLLIVAEITVAVFMSTGAMLALRSFQELTATGPGFDRRDLLTLRTNLPGKRYADQQSRNGFAQELIEDLRALPGVEALILWGPSMLGLSEWYRTFAADGNEAPTVGDALVSRYHGVSPRALRDLGIPLLRGRGIEARDLADSTLVAVVGESMGQALYPGEDPIGRKFYRWRGPESYKEGERITIVGVAADALLAGRTGPIYNSHDIYLPYQQMSRPDMSILLRSPGAGTLAPQVRQTLQAIDPGLAIYDVMTMEERWSRAEQLPRFLAVLISGFAAGAVGFAALGLYTVVAYSVSRRTREVAVRIAIGGRAADIVGWIGREALPPVAIGMALGLGGIVLLKRFLTDLLYGIEPLDPMSLVAVVLMMALTTVVALWVPLRRALRIDPASALRAE